MNTRTLIDRATARALALALRPGWDRHDAAVSLARLASGNPHVLRVALARVRRAQLERPSLVGYRASHALLQALRAAESDRAELATT